MCENCGHAFEQFQSITAGPLRKCPQCRKAGLKRLIGAGSGLIFKGSGFYGTDYRSESYKKAEKSEKGVPDKGPTEKKAETKTKDTKTAEKAPAKDKKKSA
jgi:putative FmdB family regulatory protein